MDAILNEMDKDGLKTLLYALIPIVKMDAAGKYLIGT